MAMSKRRIVPDSASRSTSAGSGAASKNSNAWRERRRERCLQAKDAAATAQAMRAQRLPASRELPLGCRLNFGSNGLDAGRVGGVEGGAIMVHLPIAARPILPELNKSPNALSPRRTNAP